MGAALVAELALSVGIFEAQISYLQEEIANAHLLDFPLWVKKINLKLKLLIPQKITFVPIMVEEIF